LTGHSARGLAVTYLSLVVLIPIAAVVTHAFGNGFGPFWSALTQPEALSAIRLTLWCSAAGSLLNMVAGTATAWVLARDRFPGRSLLNALIDLPFALPTVVAGVTFYTLYGPHSPFHVNVTGTWIGITVAITFVTLPFSVRAVQPILEARTFTAEAAAATLGASSTRVFRTITLPALAPAILTGTGLAFARAMGEYGSVVFISNNLPYRSEVASSYVYSLANSGQINAASAVSVGLLVMALVVLTGVNIAARRVGQGQ
jgi:sulfate transport system permease protein